MIQLDVENILVICSDTVVQIERYRVDRQSDRFISLEKCKKNNSVQKSPRDGILIKHLLRNGFGILNITFKVQNLKL